MSKLFQTVWLLKRTSKIKTKMFTEQKESKEWLKFIWWYCSGLQVLGEWELCRGHMVCLMILLAPWWASCFDPNLTPVLASTSSPQPTLNQLIFWNCTLYLSLGGRQYLLLSCIIQSSKSLCSISWTLKGLVWLVDWRTGTKSCVNRGMLHFFSSLWRLNPDWLPQRFRAWTEQCNSTQGYGFCFGLYGHDSRRLRIFNKTRISYFKFFSLHLLHDQN